GPVRRSRRALDAARARATATTCRGRRGRPRRPPGSPRLPARACAAGRSEAPRPAGARQAGAAQAPRAFAGRTLVDQGPVTALASRIGGSPGAIARAAAFLVEERVAELAAELPNDTLLARHSPQAWVVLTRIPPSAPVIFSAWVGALQHASTGAGVTSYRAFLGDVAEAAYRTLQHGVEAETLLGEVGRSFLLDTICAELPGTTDFLAARGMAWLLGTLEPTDDTVRSAIERARG